MHKVNKWLDANIDHLFTLDWSELEKYAQKNDIDISSLVARDNCINHFENKAHFK